MSSRRDFLQQLSALSLGAVFVPGRVRLPRWTRDPFTLGVASGDPASDGVVLWTRLAPEPLAGGGMPETNVAVRWEIAADDQMRRIVRSGAATATPAFAHAVHVEARGLAPDRWYWYRFTAGDAVSPIGRTRTMPPRGARAGELRLIVASCQHYEQGLFTAHRHLAGETPDLVAHLGDYIYESTAPGRVRQHGSPPPETLDEYRTRYALYKLDADLQAAHAAAPWIVTWDDHEVENNYAGDIAGRSDVDREAFLLQRAAAYRAYYEHQPLRRPALPRGPNALLYRTLDVGALVRFHVLDTRQYRSDQACGDGRQVPCAELADPSRTLLGATQERWLFRGLRASHATWNVLAQQVIMTPIDTDPGPGERLPMDPWAGYPVARDRVTRFLHNRGRQDVVVLAGDIHANFANQVRTAYGDEPGAIVASEFVGTSISSGGDGSDAPEYFPGMLAANPSIRYHSNRRGYIRCIVTPTAWRADFRVVPFVTRPGAPVSTHASWVATHNTAGPEPA